MSATVVARHVYLGQSLVPRSKARVQAPHALCRAQQRTTAHTRCSPSDEALRTDCVDHLNALLDCSQMRGFVAVCILRRKAQAGGPWYMTVLDGLRSVTAKARYHRYLQWNVALTGGMSNERGIELLYSARQARSERVSSNASTRPIAMKSSTHMCSKRFDQVRTITADWLHEYNEEGSSHLSARASERPHDSLGRVPPPHLYAEASNCPGVYF
jgi:hypothetical protein